MEKQHFEILLEEMNSKFNLVMETYGSLQNQITAMGEEWNKKHELTDFKIDTLNKKFDTKIDAVESKLTARIDAFESKLSARIDGVESALTARIDGVESTLSANIDAVGSDLSAHRADTEAHHNIYCVKED